MKINDLLEEVKLGKETYKNIKHFQEIKNAPENNKISFILKASIDKLNENENIMNNLKNAYHQIKIFEEKATRVSTIQESYARMKTDDIKKFYNNIILETKNANNKKLLINSLAIINYAVEVISENCKKFKPSLDVLEEINEDINKELIFIKENI